MTIPVVHDMEVIMHKDSFMREYKINMDFYITAEASQDILSGSDWGQDILKTIGKDVFEAYWNWVKEHDNTSEMYNNPRIVE